ncbi:MAG: hypothetical protein U1E33_06550 [Rhodospirillales bacterium]
MKLLQWAPMLVVAMLIGSPASAQQYGTPAEAKVMLEKVVTDMKANKAKTLQDITAGASRRRIFIRSAAALTATLPLTAPMPAWSARA